MSAKATTRTSKPASTGSKSVSNALAVKRALHARRPKFIRHNSNKKGEVKAAWRKPRGLHNKQKDNRKNRAPVPDCGWRTPEAVRGLHSSGLVIVRVATLSELEMVDPKTHGVVIAGVGARKQILLIDAAAKKGLRVLNYDATKRKEALARAHKARQEKREAAREAKKENEKKKEKAAKDKQASEESKSEEEKKAEQEKIKEEVLTDKHQ